MNQPQTAAIAPPGDVSIFSLRPWLWSILAAAPFLAFTLIHYVRLGENATGLTVYDLPYYAANARAVLDRGWMGFYPNPFDPDPAAPVIYFHWLILVLAGLIGPLGLDPGHALLLIQVVGAIASARIMFSLVTWLLPTSRWRILLYFLTMWGAGFLISGKLVTNLLTGAPWNADLFDFDPGLGLWFLNFGRNLILPTEAVYHALMMGCWLAILRNQWMTAILLLVAMTTTHPFTGAQAIAIIGAWIAIRMAADSGLNPLQTRRVQSFPFWFFIAFAGVSAAFVAYYFVFLPIFPEHQHLQHTWMLNWTLPSKTIPLAYSSAAILAWLAIRSDPAWRKRVAFLLVAAGVSFLLANHQWFIAPRQPIHFTRGYIWTPLWLAGLPTLARLFDWLAGPPPAASLPPTTTNGNSPKRLASRVLGPILIAAVSSLIIFDNVAYLTIAAVTVYQPGFGLTPDERAAFNDLAQRHFTGVLLADDERTGYLAAVYTSARPWLGHFYNTPARFLRQKKLNEFKDTPAPSDLLNDVDLALTSHPRIIRRLQDEGWQKLSTHGDLQLWQKSP